MWEIIVTLHMMLTPPQHLYATRPYISCIDGHIVTSLNECPQVPKHNNPNPPAPIGGGPRGLLGLGGLGGIL